MTHAWAPHVRSALRRFFAKTRAAPPPPGKEHLGHCLLWTGAQTKGAGRHKGGGPYGSFKVGGCGVRTTVFVGVASGKWREGHVHDHLCEVSLCVREAHFEAVTPTVNSQRRWDGRRKIDREEGVMVCTVVKLPTGETAIVCGPRARLPRCSNCGSPAPLLCDWKVRGGGTCDAPICKRCTLSPAPDKDLCPAHAAEWRNRLEAGKS